MRSARGLVRLARRLHLGPPPPHRHSGLLGRALAELGYHGSDLASREVAAFFSCSLRTARRAMTYGRRAAPEVRHGWKEA